MSRHITVKDKSKKSFGKEDGTFLSFESYHLKTTENVPATNMKLYSFVQRELSETEEKQSRISGIIMITEDALHCWGIT